MATLSINIKVHANNKYYIHILFKLNLLQAPISFFLLRIFLNVCTLIFLILTVALLNWFIKRIANKKKIEQNDDFEEEDEEEEY